MKNSRGHRKSDERANAAGHDDARNRGEEAASQLEMNSIYRGVIQGVDPINLSYTVKLDDRDSILDNCQWAAGIFSNMFGIQTKYIPTLGTAVVVLYGPTPMIISSYGTRPADINSGMSREEMASGKMKKDIGAYTGEGIKAGSRAGAGETPGAEMLEGEFDIAHSTGCGIAFLTNLVKMKASDRAKVETHLLNDMVRIISDTFRHHSSFGDFEIYNDGRLNSRINGTSYEHEAWGTMSKSDEKVPTKSGAVDFDSIDRIKETGRWRFSEYLGFLGDFLHKIITDPTETIGRYAEDAARAGKSRMQFMNDGTILAQSVADIVLERVTRIVTPTEKKRNDDPQGNVYKDFESLENSYLQIWDYGQDFEDMSKTCYQLREYARYLSGFHSYARFHQLDKDWKVDSEEESPSPAWSSKEKDRESVHTGLERFDVYSCFRIMRDGSQVFMDGYGSSVVMSRGVVQISASKHLELEAAGNINMRAGQDINMTARRNIDIVSVVGGIIFKSRTWLKGLCEWGSVWFKSDADTKEGAPTKEPDDPEQDPEPEILTHGIVLEAPKSGALVETDHQVMFNIKGNQEDDKGDFLIKNRSGGVCADVGDDFTVHTTQGSVKLRSKDIFMKAGSANMGVSRFNVIGTGGDVIFRTTPGFVEANRFRAASVDATDYLSGPEFKYLHFSSTGQKSESAGNMVFTTSGLEVLQNTENDTDAFDEWVEEDPEIEEPEHPVQWRLREPADYRWDTEYEIFESITQQTIRQLNPSENHYLDPDAYGSWSGTDLPLKTSTRTETSTPWPGKDAQHFTHTGGDPLYKPLGKKYSSLSPDQKTPLELEDVSWKFLKK